MDLPTFIDKNDPYVRQRALEQIEHLISVGMEDAAKKIDADMNLGYFNPCKYWLDQFITLDEQMLELKETIRKLSTIQDNVLLRGETGTGKELLAHALHGSRKGNFIEINCAGMPEHLIESELFGHVKGAFTGAQQETTGLFQEAADGTIFLDEIGELPLPLQAKLLRVIQDKKLRKVGGKETTAPINFRLVCATHQDLAELIKLRMFRSDLYYRISTFEEYTKPLSARPGDIVPILNTLVAKPPQELCSLVAHRDLPGNVRSIQALVRRWQIKGQKALL